MDKKSLDVRKDVMFSRVTKGLARRLEESAKQGEIPGKMPLRLFLNMFLQKLLQKRRLDLTILGL